MEPQLSLTHRLRVAVYDAACRNPGHASNWCRQYHMGDIYVLFFSNLPGLAMKELYFASPALKYDRFQLF